MIKQKVFARLSCSGKRLLSSPSGRLAHPRTLLVLLITAATGAWADEVTFSVGELKNSLPSGNTSVEIPYGWTVSSQQPKVTIARQDGAPGILSVSQVLPLNANNTMTVSVPTGGSIDGVTFTTNPTNQARNISASTGSCSNGTWSPGEGDVTSVTFTPTNNFRITQIVVVYTPAPAPAGYTVSIDDAGVDASNWQATPAEQRAGQTVTLSYSGKKKIRSITIEAAPAPTYTMAKDATTEDKGKLICTSGHIHVYGEDAACTADRVAMITYVGSSTGEEEPYNHGLAMALSDVNGGSNNIFKWNIQYTDAGHIKQTDSNNFISESGLQYNNNAHNNDDYPAFKAAIANNGTAVPTGCSAWFLPTAYQWQLMLTAAGSYTALRTGFSSVGGTNLQKEAYWSSTEYNADHAWDFDFYEDFTGPAYKYYPFYVRSTVAF